MPTMKAVAFTPGPVSGLHIIEKERPTATGRDILVRIKAISVNPVDTKCRQGKFPADPVLGWDAAGIVAECGPEVTRWKVGDEVMYAGALGRQGTNAQFSVVDERIVGRKPNNWDWADAASLPLVGLTAWELLIDHFNLSLDKPNPGTLLIINGAGGVGTAAAQLASRVLQIPRVISTASRPETIAWCKQNGATDTIDHHKPLDVQLKELGVDNVEYNAILYGPTPGYVEQLIKTAAPRGKIGSIVESDDPIPLADAFSKALSFSWVFMLSRPMYNHDLEFQGEALDKMATLAEEGVLTSFATEKYKFTVENLRKIHQLLENGKAIGKHVLVLEDDDITEA
ncbi:hypothetical protein YB2330_000065 [Saitoella coloradoensis]